MYIEDYMPKARFVGEIIGQLSMKMDLPKKFVEMYEQEFGEIYESLPQQRFSGQEKYRDIYETNKKMTEWMLQNFEDMYFDQS